MLCPRDRGPNRLPAASRKVTGAVPAASATPPATGPWASSAGGAPDSSSEGVLLDGTSPKAFRAGSLHPEKYSVHLKEPNKTS